MKEKNRGWTLYIAIGIVGIFTIVLFLYRNAAQMVYRNLTSMHIDMEEKYGLSVADGSDCGSWAGGSTYEKLPYASDSDSQYLDLYVPNTALNKGRPKLFVLVHGGGFIYNDSQSRQTQLMYRYFRDNGYACATVNYRLAQEEPFPGALSDVKAAVRFLKVHADLYGYDADRVAIWGESAGGYLAVAAAVTNDDEFMDVEYIGQKDYEQRTGQKVSASVNVCVNYYGAVELSMKDDDWKSLGVPGIVTDMANSWLHTDFMEGYSDVESFWLRKETSKLTGEEKSYSDIYTYVSKNLNKDSDIKFWIAHGDCDITVPILQSQRLYETLKELIGDNHVELRIIEGAGHAGDIMYTDEELSKIRSFLDENL